MNSVEMWRSEKIAKTAVAALLKNGFDAHYCTAKDDAIALVSPYLVSGRSIGFGGSMTIKALGLVELAKNAGCEILDHSEGGLTPEAKRTILRRQLTSDVFLSSSNAVTLDGQLFNIDGNGNRVAALTFGPTKTIVVVGINKLVRTIDEAYTRCELYASPMNVHRLGKATPCENSGECMDCDGESRICRIYSILRKRPSSSDFTVILIGEVLGF